MVAGVAGGFIYTSIDSGVTWIERTTAGYSTTNANINNGGLHAMNNVPTTIALTAGQSYPFRIIFGELSGGDDCQLYYSRNGSANSYNFSGLFFS